jgi:hypothetical protein
MYKKRIVATIYREKKASQMKGEEKRMQFTHCMNKNPEQPACNV